MTTFTHRLRRSLPLLFGLAVLSLAAPALAQTETIMLDSIEVRAPVDAPAMAAPAIDPELAVAVDAMKGLLAAGKAGKWLLLVMFALKLAIAGLRFAAKKLPPSKFTEVLTSKWGGWAMNFLGSQVGAFATAAATGTLTADVALALVFAGVTTSLAAAGTRELVSDLKPAKAAGVAAAANPGPTLGA